MSNTVKYFHSDMAGAPVLSGTAGSMVGVLDACLVNGWGSGTVDSIVIASGVATVTRGAGHPFEPDMVVEIAGGTVTGGTINGQFKVATVVGNTYTFPVPSLPNQTATGTITHKIAALGFTKPYTDTNLAAYRSSDVSGTQFYLRVDDTGTTDARVRAHETMTSISDDTLRFPTEAQQSGGYFWSKSNAADSTTRRWVLFGNSRFFILCLRWSDNTSGSMSAVAAFGDYIPVSSSDAYRCFINGALVSSTGSAPGGLGSGVEMDSASTSAAGSRRIARPYTGVGAPSAARLAYQNLIVSSTSAQRSGDNAGGGNEMMYPNGSDGGLYVSQVFISESAVGCLRGRIPGLYAFPQAIGPSVFANRQKVTGVGGLTGRSLMIQNSANGCFGVDITGPWD